jgi:hypothetical protein
MPSLYICNSLYDEVVRLRTFGYAHKGATHLVWCIVMSVRRACSRSLRGQFGVVFLRKTSIFRTCCAWSGCTLRRLLRGVSHARVASAGPCGDFVLAECRRPSARSFFDVNFCGGFFTCILHDSASLKTSPPGRKRVRARIKLFFANYKDEMALMSQTENLRRLSMFQECSKSSPFGVVSLYALGDAFVLTMKGPSHLGSSLPLDSVRAIRTSTRSPSLNFLGMTACVTEPHK